MGPEGAEATGLRLETQHPWSWVQHVQLDFLGSMTSLRMLTTLQLELAAASKAYWLQLQQIPNSRIINNQQTSLNTTKQSSESSKDHSKIIKHQKEYPESSNQIIGFFLPMFLYVS
jgi:hypothetical protein